MPSLLGGVQIPVTRSNKNRMPNRHPIFIGMSYGREKPLQVAAKRRISSRGEQPDAELARRGRILKKLKFDYFMVIVGTIFFPYMPSSMYMLSSVAFT